MSDLPHIKIISDGLTHGDHTRIMSPDEHGNWVNISTAINEIDIHMKVGELNTAEIKAILVGAEIDAVVTAMQTKVLPPPAPKPQLQFTTWEPRRHWFRKRSAWGLDRLDPAGDLRRTLEEGSRNGWTSPQPDTS